MVGLTGNPGELGTVDLIAMLADLDRHAARLLKAAVDAGGALEAVHLARTRGAAPEADTTPEEHGFRALRAWHDLRHEAERIADLVADLEEHWHACGVRVTVDLEGAA